MVIDHGSKPPISEGITLGWAEDMAGLAHDTGAFCKLSGLVTEAGPDWQPKDLQPYVDHLINTFGPARLIWGSDWPVCTRACSYARWCAVTDTLLQDLSQADRDAILGQNAGRAYNLRN